MSESVVFASATYANDLRRFALLHQSLQRFAPGILHRVAVHTEDLPLFKRHFGQPADTEFIPTAELLHAELEIARRRHATLANFALARKAYKLLTPLGHFNGYLAQQLTKFELARRSSARHALIIDSDTFLARPLDLPRLEGVLMRERRPVCFSAACPPDLHRTWQSNALAAIDADVACITESTDGICIPFPTTPVILDAMTARIEATLGDHWQRALVKAFRTFSEFLIYEKFCRYVLPASQVALEPPPAGWTNICWQRPDADNIRVALSDKALRENLFFCLQSNFKGFDYNKSYAQIESYLNRAKQSSA